MGLVLMLLLALSLTLTWCNEIMAVPPERLLSTGNDSQEMPTKTADKDRPTAMELILAANNRPYKSLMQEKTKRMNIAGKNESVGDTVIEANQERRISDDLLEGDILLDPMEPEDFRIIKLREENKDGLVESLIRKRQASRQMKRLWHNRQVPYIIDSSLYHIRNLILRTIQKFNQISCVKFVPLTAYNEKDWVRFMYQNGCHSKIGRDYSRSGEQIISIGQMCDSESVIMHEMLHAVGFYHEQSRPDRDRYLKILWENIKPVYQDQFLKYSHGEIDQFGIGYNYQSIMQYPQDAFSSSTGLHSMESITDSNLKLGSDTMTTQDINELDTLYDCKSTTYNAWTNWGSYTPCDDNCFKYKQRYCYGKTPQSCGTANSYGVQTQKEQCGSNECPAPINGHWGRWEPWGECSVNCNEGIQTRVRKCNDPAPSNNGADCPSSEKDRKLCIKPKCVLGEYDTDFRNGVLGKVWQNDIYDTSGFDWSIGQGKTQSESTGPSADHLGSNGYYIFVESTGRVKFDMARLISRMMPATWQKKRCLKFYYHMFGQTTGSLTVYKFPKIGKRTEIFRKDGAQGDKWKLAHVTLRSAVDFQLVIEAKVAGPTYSDIAIDELFINEGSCDCQDEYENCMMWAKKGDCTNSSTFMSQHCKRSCSLCGCKDKEKDCPIWGMKECKLNSVYMEEQCPLTCRVCHCHDDHIKCNNWAKKKECIENPLYMLKVCPKSCGKCTNPLPT